LNVTVFDPNFEDGLFQVGDLIAGKFACFESLNQMLNIGSNTAVAFGQTTNILFKSGGEANLNGEVTWYLNCSRVLKQAELHL